MSGDFRQTFIFLSQSFYLYLSPQLYPFLLPHHPMPFRHPAPKFFIMLFAFQYKIKHCRARGRVPHRSKQKGASIMFLQQRKQILLKCKIDRTIIKSQIYLSVTPLKVLRNPLQYFTEAFYPIYILFKLQQFSQDIKGKLTLETIPNELYFSILYFFSQIVNKTAFLIT